jgi:hypothetical protein
MNSAGEIGPNQEIRFIMHGQSSYTRHIPSKYFKLKFTVNESCNQLYFHSRQYSYKIVSGTENRKCSCRHMMLTREVKWNQEVRLERYRR